MIKMYPDVSLKGGYKKLYKKVRELIQNEWKGHEKPSPAFRNDIVNVSSKSFKHVIGKVRNYDYVDSMRRLSQFPNAIQILHGCSSPFEVRVISREFSNYSLLGQLDSGKKLKVIVSENRQSKRKVFLNVFEFSTQLNKALRSSDISKNLLEPIKEIALSQDEELMAKLLMVGHFKDRSHLILGFEQKIVLTKVPLNRLIEKKVGREIRIYGRGLSWGR